ncbi:DUF547 domain-containing protein [Pelagibius marinus]|uniref:DUF547 domain-containing protein n=1 Tax=Pelagibius marinus TaxID=2762760 RepID=UPI001872867A|nr:DUF547 domain-containing protein [Pelagibius marinus]
MRRLALLLFLILPLGGFTSSERLFAPSADLWPRWERHDPASRESLDFAAWDALLRRVVISGGDGINRVDYRGLAAADALAGIVADLAAVQVSAYDRDQQLAYWINLYNAVTLQVVAQHYPVVTIRDIDISPGWFADGPWDAEVVTVEGEALTLNDIEHRILRPIWRDPRVHYAVNCASLGCPNLAREAYRGETVDRQLEEAARVYINHPRGVTIADGEVTVSKIYDWFLEDFGGSTETLLAHLRRYAGPELAGQLAAAGDIDGTAYDWTLNDASE